MVAYHSTENVLQRWSHSLIFRVILQLSQLEVGMNCGERIVLAFPLDYSRIARVLARVADLARCLVSRDSRTPINLVKQALRERYGFDPYVGKKTASWDTWCSCRYQLLCLIGVM